MYFLRPLIPWTMYSCRTPRYAHWRPWVPNRSTHQHPTIHLIKAASETAWTTFAPFTHLALLDSCCFPLWFPNHYTDKSNSDCLSEFRCVRFPPQSSRKSSHGFVLPQRPTHATNAYVCTWSRNLQRRKGEMVMLGRCVSKGWDWSIPLSCFPPNGGCFRFTKRSNRKRHVGG